MNKDLNKVLVNQIQEEIKRFIPAHYMKCTE